MDRPYLGDEPLKVLKESVTSLIFIYHLANDQRVVELSEKCVLFGKNCHSL
jgi:hypothetical protein